MAAIIRSEKDITPRERVMFGASPGRRKGRTEGGHVIDLSDLKKAISLCGSCLPRFNHVKHGYVAKRNLPFVRGRCDGCEQYHPQMRLLIHHTLAELE